jgi:hypothetical protein
VSYLCAAQDRVAELERCLADDGDVAAANLTAMADVTAGWKEVRPVLRAAHACGQRLRGRQQPACADARASLACGMRARQVPV